LYDVILPKYFLVKLKLKDTVFWAEYGHPGQALPGIHFDLDDLPFQIDHSAGVYTRQHVTSLGWVRENVNGGWGNVVRLVITNIVKL